MKKVLIILCCATLLILGTSLNVCAYIDNTGGLVGCFPGHEKDYDVQGLIESWLGDDLGFDLLYYAKVDDPPGTSGGLTVGVGAEGYYGTFNSDVALNAYLLKAGHHGFELYYLPTTEQEGVWAITCLTNKQGIPKQISHFNGFVPIPPSALLLGSGLICLVGIRRKLRK